MSYDAEQTRIAKQRIKQIFEYLKALNEHRNPAIRQVREQPWSIWLDDLPSHPSIEFPQRVARPMAVEGEENTGEPSFLLRVRRPKLTTAPTPPDEIRGWLRPGWDDPQKVVEPLESLNQRDPEGETFTVRFEDDPARRTVLEHWLKRRQTWKDAELPARAAMSVFDKLYALHGQMEREAERFDLVMGVGVLSWQQQEGNIYHPILLQRVQLVFNAQQPEFVIVDADFGSELYTGLLQSVSGVDPRMLRARREDFEVAGYHPLDVEASGLLEGLVNQLSAQGAFVGDRRPDLATANPTIGRSPVLFLRSRTKGIGTAIECVLDSMHHRDDFCDALRNIVGCDSASVSEHSLDEEPRSSGSERPIHDVFFGKPANREQLRIAQAIDRHGSVLVQGPPGTGKSHTIANLIGHLLAHGQSVLVTSHTTKALRVLREHLVEELRPLCVSVLESDLESRRQLEESVQAISSRLSESDADELEREAKGLEQRRACLIAELGLRREELKNARADEYRSVVYGGNEIAPSEAARIVAAGTGRHDWVPGPVALGEPCPLSAAEVRELYETNASTRPGDDRYLDRSLPDQLPVPGDVARWFQQSDQLAECGQLDRRHWPKVGFKPGHIGQLESLITELKTTVQEFAAFDGWKLAAVDARRHPQPDGGPWDHLLRKIDETVELALQVQTDVVVHRPQVSEESPLQAQSVLALEIHEHLLRGGRLGWLWLPWRLHWKKALSIWTVQGRPPKTADQVAAILRLLAVKISRTELQVLWEGLMAAHGAPGLAELGEEPERAASQFASIIREVLDWWPRRWTPLEQRLRDIGFEWQRFVGEQPPDLSRYGELRRIMTAVQNRLIGDLERTKKHLESLRVRKQMADLLNHLGMSDRPEVVAVRKAIEDKDPEAYSRAYHECMAAVARRKHALRRKELLARLRRNGSAETWAEAILHRHDLHCGSTPPGDVFKAWEWRQLNDELVRRAEVDLEQLGRQIEDLQDQLKSVTNQLIDRKAWAGQVRRTRRAQRQALIGWLSIINRIGKGFGRRVPQLRREAQQKMEECREAVPVWVMPLSRLVENFDFSAPRFDVVIIDEASQCDVMALMALAIARKVVVVGDDKQVSPVAVGQQLDIVGNLIRLHLEGIPNAVLYDGRMSIYDLAKQSFPGLICLMEHFRCVPDIIQFSNHLSYEGTIKPLREKASSQLTPHVVPYRVEGATRGSGKVNAEEAAVVATLIVAACEHEAYVKQTFGVISLVGDEQAMEIERLLLQHLLPDEYERRRIICGNSAQFQGDERDVMFLSMVQSPGGGPLPMLDRPDFQQRYNVAASRARNQMWVVYSLNHEVDLKPGDLRRRLVEHALDPEAITRDLERAGTPAESPFEQQVYERLVRRGYRVRPQWPVGRYRIDLVVEGAERRAAVECDGDRDHPIEKLSEDMERQAILERLGWRFIRIRGSVFFRNPDTAIDKLVAKLNELGIHPERRELHVEAEVEAHRPNLVAEIIRRAAELRLLWKTPDSLIPREKIPHVTDL